MNSSLLVYTHTAGYRHASIPAAISAIQSMGYNATFSEDPGQFDTLANLESYGALVFLHNSEDVLGTQERKDNLRSYLIRGGGLAGIHSGNAILFQESWFSAAIGAWFDRHPELQNATFTVTNSSHPSTAHLPASGWNYVEEVYNYRSDPVFANVSVLMSVDEASYADSGKAGSAAVQGTPHPIAWFRDGSGNATGQEEGQRGIAAPVDEGFTMPGRMWYTSLGHTSEIWSDPMFRQHIQGGLDYTLGIQRDNSTASATDTTTTSTTDMGAATAGIAAAGNGGARSSAARTTMSKPWTATSALLGLVLIGVLL